MTRALPDTPMVATDRRSFAMRNCLGRGGFGEVYRATMSSAGGVRMEVAVKVLHADVDPQSQAVQRLADEARLLGAVRHPCVLAVHGLVVLDGRMALVTEYVEGADLDKCVRGDDPIPRRALVEMTGRVAEALDAAWRAPSPDGSGPLRLVHRDIKPANIRLGKHGEVKVLDFGIARAGNLEREAHTETNAMLGSYLYMAPERFLDGNDHGPAIDVFALGCTLFETLAGQRLFAELTLKDMYLLVLDPNRYERFLQERLEKLPADLEPELVSLVYRLVALSPRERPSHTELARTCADLVDRMKGRSLDRWARARVWPAPKVVRGVLDGSVLTESHVVSNQLPSAQGSVPPGVVTGFTPAPLASRSPSGATSGNVSGVISRRHRDPADTFEGVLSRTVSATFERPTVVVGMGFGVIGLGAMAAGAALVVLLGIGIAWKWSRPDPAPPAPVVVVPPAPTVEVPRPGGSTAVVAPAPGPKDPAPPKPAVTQPPGPEAPRPSPTPPEPPAPVVVVAQPVPQPAPQAAVVPQPAAGEKATVLLVGESKVLVEFRGPSGTTRARTLPPGQYDVVAWFGGRPTPVPNSTNFLSGGGTYRLRCSDLKQTCTWEK